MSDYDFETAEAMLHAKRYLYVGFMCHQVIEKILKAYWSHTLEEPPLKIHSLSRLAEKSGLDKAMSEEQLDFIDMLEPLKEKQKEKAIAQAKKLLISEGILSESQLAS